MNNETTTVRASLIGETSAGGLAIEIHENDTLVYSHDYASAGLGQKEYLEMLRQAIDDMLALRSWSDFDGCDMDGDDVMEQDTAPTTLVTLTYDGSQWAVEGRDTISDDVIRANADRLPAEIVASVSEGE